MFIKRIGSTLIEKEGKFLLIKSKRGPTQGLWNTPGGKAPSDLESFEDCAVRETKEETDLTVKIGRLISTFEFQESSDILVMKKIYEGTIIGGSIDPPKDEIEDMKWFTPEEISPPDQFTEGATTSIKCHKEGKLGEIRTVERVP